MSTLLEPVAKPSLSEAIAADLPNVREFEVALRNALQSRIIAPDSVWEARTQIEVRQLYEKRQRNLEREHHFARLRLVTEAALGVLAFDDPSLVKQPRRKSFMALGACLERGQLQAVIESTGLRFGTNIVARQALLLGWTAVSGDVLSDSRHPVIPWREARQRIAELGLDPETIPSSSESAEREALRREEVAQRNREAWAALANRRVAAKERTVSKWRKASSKDVSAAFGYLRQAMQRLDAAAATESSGSDLLEEAYGQLSEAEAAICEHMRMCYDEVKFRRTSVLRAEGLAP